MAEGGGGGIGSKFIKYELNSSCDKEQRERKQEIPFCHESSLFSPSGDHTIYK